MPTRSARAHTHAPERARTGTVQYVAPGWAGCYRRSRGSIAQPNVSAGLHQRHVSTCTAEEERYYYYYCVCVTCMIPTSIIDLLLVLLLLLPTIAQL